MSADLEILDGAIPLVRNDQPWEWFVMFWDDTSEETPTELGRQTVLTSNGSPVRNDDNIQVLTSGAEVRAEIRWQGGSQPVTVTISDVEGQARLSLTAAQTANMPLGRLSKLYIAIGNTDTEAIVPVNVIEGLVP